MQEVEPVKELTEFQTTHNDSDLAYLKLRFAECPIQTALGVLGKKWAMLILRDIGVYKKERLANLFDMFTVRV